MNLRITLLGTGTSHGVPMIGCECPVCRSTDPRDRRTRPSILIEASQDAGRPLSILVDTSTDLRAQALTARLAAVDAILFTHSHADHILGLDEVRRFNVMQRAAIPCYADARTCSDLRRMFNYVFDKPPSTTGGGIPKLALFEIGGPFVLRGPGGPGGSGSVDIVPIPVMHGSRPILGFRLGTFAYLTDCNRIPDTSWPLLDGVQTLVLDALRDRPHTTHFTVQEALEVVTRLAPERAYFTHICHDLPHAATCARLPPGVALGYDGQVLDAQV